MVGVWAHRRRRSAGRAAPGPPDIRPAASVAWRTSGETTTCVRDPERVARPDNRPRSSNSCGSGATSQGARNTLAGHREQSKKNSRCVTTRRRNLRRIAGLRCGPGPVTACLLGSGVPRFDHGILAASGLPSRRLPAVNFILAHGVLAIPLIPLPWAILESTSFAQAQPQPGTSYSGRKAAGWLIVEGAHGSVLLPREARGECCYIPSGR